MSAVDSREPLPLARLVLVGAVIPAIFSYVDHRLLMQLQVDSARTIVVALTMLVFVVQIGLMGWLCGRLLTNGWWRWGLYLWGWVLVDLQLVSATVFAGGGWGSGQILPASLFAAQIGLTIVWGFLGDTYWPIRLPACAVLGTLLALPMDLGYGFAEQIFPIQLIALAVLCLLLRLRGFRLLRVEMGGAPPAGTASVNVVGGKMQFNIRHVLIWTTSLAIVLGVLRALDLLSLGAWMEDSQQSLVAVLTGGLLLASAFVVALWAAVGSGRLWLRVGLLVIALPLVGFVLALLDWHQSTGPNFSLTELFTRPWIRQEFLHYKGWHVVWVALAGSLLAASLVILRVIGYRLARSAKTPPIPATSRDA